MTNKEEISKIEKLVNGSKVIIIIPKDKTGYLNHKKAYKHKEKKEFFEFIRAQTAPNRTLKYEIQKEDIKKFYTETNSETKEKYNILLLKTLSSLNEICVMSHEGDYNEKVIGLIKYGEEFKITWE